MFNLTKSGSEPTPNFDRLCILFLAFDWIFFGSMHFSLHEATVRQIPDFIFAGSAFWLGLKSAAVVITGIAEVATGILILVPSLRRWAALSSLILLGVLLPAVYNLLSDDASLEGSRAFHIFFRTLLLPNNILMAVCSFHLWQNPNSTSLGFAEIVEKWLAAPRRTGPATEAAHPADSASWRWWPTSTQSATLLVAFLLLAANCAGFITMWASSITDRMTAYLWAMMCIALGALIGFLFAVPRFNRTSGRGAPLLPNTNIETVSDWLTKILVGVGLINLRQIGEFLQATSSTLAAAVGSNSSFAMGLILYFFVVGLIQGYLLTRMFLAWQFLLELQASGDDKTKKP
jgi:uncharacterized membrane protein